MAPPIQTDALVVGGGVAGLFTLAALRAAGHGALLLERTALGTGQTTSSQGILHAGVKYSLGGVAGDDAKEASEAAALWTGMMDGGQGPDLRGLRVLAREEFLWRTAGLRGAAGMLGAKLALRTRPEALEKSQQPAWLAGVSGEVLRLAETVIDPRDLLERLAGAQAGCVALGQVQRLEVRGERAQATVTVGGAALEVQARRVYLCAGQGNEALLAMAGLGSHEPMQRRPLRQAMVRGPLPLAFGHCIDGARTRVTITSDTDGPRVVWHVGGELAERGLEVDVPTFLRKAKEELQACLPGADLRDAEWSSYDVDRAEPRTAQGRRPAHAHVRVHGPVVALWPVKLVLAPRAAQRAVEAAGAPAFPQARWPAGTPVPCAAPRPWESATWSRLP